MVWSAKNPPKIWSESDAITMEVIISKKFGGLSALIGFTWPFTFLFFALLELHDI